MVILFDIVSGSRFATVLFFFFFCPRRLLVCCTTGYIGARSTVRVAELSVLLCKHLSMGNMPQHQMERCDGHNERENSASHTERYSGQYDK